MKNNLIFTELREQHRMLREAEKNLTADEKRNRHQPILEAARLVVKASNIARKEGLLSLEEMASELPAGELNDYARKIVLYIVDGTDPEFVEELALLKYFSSDPEPELAIEMLMMLVGLLSVQGGMNPRVIYGQMDQMMPDDISGRSDEQEESGEEADVEPEKPHYTPEEFDSFCKGGIHLNSEDEGYGRLRILDEIIRRLDDFSIQVVFRGKTVPQLMPILKGVSGEARAILLKNLSAHNADEVLSMTKPSGTKPSGTKPSGTESSVADPSERLVDKDGDDLITDEREKAEISRAVKEILDEIYTLDYQGILKVPGSYGEHLKYVINLMDREDEQRHNRMKECDKLIDALREYRKKI